MRANQMTKDDFNARQRLNRKLNGNLATRRYEKTIKGFLMRSYRNMKSRVTGVQWKKSHLYCGLSLLDKEEFYAWSLLSCDFHSLFAAWQHSGYDRKLTPSVDRIDSLKGYEKGNIRWITHSENSRLGSLSPFRGQSSPRMSTSM